MPDAGDGVSIIVPAWNEELAIGDTLAQLKRAMESTSHPHEVIVVDDGSTDRTAEIAESHGATLLRHPVNLGYGRSLKDGMRAAKYTRVATLDADGTYPIHELPRLLAEMGNCAMVVGARQGPAYRGSLFKNPARRLFRALAEFAAGTEIPDINSGFRVFRLDEAEPFFHTLPRGFSFPTTLTLALLLNARPVKYVPIDYYARKGKSKIRIVRDTLRSAQSILTAIALYNPLKLFLLLASFCWLLSVACLPLALLGSGGPYMLLVGEGFLAGMILMGIGFHAVRNRDHA